MFDTDQLEGVILEWGMEDVIPLPELMASLELHELAVLKDPVPMVAEMLTRLLICDKIRIFRGSWNDNDPPQVGTVQAISLLQEPHWYHFHSESRTEECLFFVNILNLRQNTLH